MSELREDSASGFCFPLPHALDKLFAAKHRFAGAFLGKLLLNDELRDNAGVVRPRHPQGIIPLHTSPADEAILERIVQRVPDVQAACDIGGWNHDGIGRLLRCRLGVKIAVFLPKLIPFPLNVLRFISFWKMCHGYAKSGATHPYSPPSV